MNNELASVCVKMLIREISEIKIWINPITATYFLTAIKNKDASRKWIILGVFGDTENFGTPFSWKRTDILCLFSRKEVKIDFVAWEPDSSFSVTHVRGLPVPYPGNSYRSVSQSLSLNVFCYQGMELRLRMAVLLAKGNASLLLNRIPAFPSREIDGQE